MRLSLVLIVLSACPRATPSAAPTAASPPAADEAGVTAPAVSDLRPETRVPPPGAPLREALDEDALVALFLDLYPRPMVSATPSAVPHILVVRVFDHAELVKDPLIPDEFLVTTNGGRFPCSAQGTIAALRAVGFVPASATSALAAASLHHERVLQTAPPKAPAGLVWPPTMTAAGDGYDVTFFAHGRDSAMGYFHQPVPEWIIRVDAHVGATAVRLVETLVWSSTPGGAAEPVRRDPTLGGPTLERRPRRPDAPRLRAARPVSAGTRRRRW